MKTHQILGLQFFGGTSREAVEEITRRGGLLVAPAAPSMINLCRDPDYRRALLSAEIAIADSGFMVLLWKLLTGETIPRISGLEHVKRLLEHESVREPGAVVWVVATEASRAKLVKYLDGDRAGRGQLKAEMQNTVEGAELRITTDELQITKEGDEKDEGDKAERGKLNAEMQNIRADAELRITTDELQITKEVDEKDEGDKAERGKRNAEMQGEAHGSVQSEVSVVSVGKPGRCSASVSADVRFPTVYVAPKYARPVADEALLALIREKRPRHVVIAVGGGIQDQLGQYLLEQLDYRPAVHCIGAALGFITGDQVRIPDWADKYYLGWFFRSLAQPKVFIPRFWSARRLPWLIFRWREKLPPLGG